MGVSPEEGVCSLVWPGLGCRQSSAQGLWVMQVCRGREHKSHVGSVLWAVLSWEPGTQLPLSYHQRLHADIPGAAQGAFRRGLLSPRLSLVPGATHPTSPPSSLSLRWQPAVVRLSCWQAVCGLALAYEEAPASASSHFLPLVLAPLTASVAVCCHHHLGLPDIFANTAFMFFFRLKFLTHSEAQSVMIMCFLMLPWSIDLHT